MKQIAKGLLQKADRAVTAADKLVPIDAESAISRAYYAMFYIAEALLAERDLEFKKHAAVHAAFGEHFAKTRLIDPKYHRWLLDAFDQRITADYRVSAELTPGDARVLVEQAKEFISAARAFLASDKS